MTLRIDVDYAYPSRLKSFLYTALGLGTSKDYLKNSKIIAKMIDESRQKVKAYWFFTPQTIPDEELLTLLNNERHEVALHIVNDPYGELGKLEDSTARKVRYYTVHGTSRLFARIMWKRWKSWAPKIPENFPLQSFYQFPTFSLDTLCYSTSFDQTLKTTEENIRKGFVIHFHPIWLFQRGKLNQRAPYYEVLRRILAVDGELESLTIKKKFSLRIARYQNEYERSILPTAELLQKLGERGVDILTFIERSWCCKVQNPEQSWVETEDNIALLHLKSHSDWWESIGKKTRNMIRKAEKNGIKTFAAEPDEKLARGIWKIYNETPIRQDRAFPHYGTLLQEVIAGLRLAKNCVYVGADMEGELVGFIQLVHGDNITVISQILSMQKHWDKAVNNALVAKAIEVCAEKHVEWIMYGRIGNHPSLDNFKRNNGFDKFPLRRYYVPSTSKGKIGVKLRVHRAAEDALPQSIKYSLIPVYNLISRTKLRMKLYLRH